MSITSFNSFGREPLAKQIADSLKLDIEKGILKRDEKLLSINVFSKKHKVARDTVEKAYNRLKAEGYITSSSGKGYFVIGVQDHRIKVLLLFNKLSYYKKVVYDAIVKSLGNNAQVDLHIHHYNPSALEQIIDNNAGKYHFYVLMPHFYQFASNENVIRIINKIPKDQLICLDKKLPGLEEQKGVYQNFKNDIYTALTSVSDLVLRYKSLYIAFPDFSNHPREILDGLAQFCKKNNLEFAVLPDLEAHNLCEGNLYIILTESDLVSLIKKVRESKYILGMDLGIISFNETVFKELLDITVFTTDFQLMGNSVAEMIMNNENSSIENPFKIIVRKSL